METINVSYATAIFQEVNQQSDGIFRLLINAIKRAYLITTPINTSNGGCVDVFSIGYMDNATTIAFAHTAIRTALKVFEGDLDFADKRIKQFGEDYQAIKILDAEMNKFSVWDILFKKHRAYSSLDSQRKKISGMQISVKDLVEVSYYKYLQAKCGTRESFVKELESLLFVKPD